VKQEPESYPYAELVADRKTCWDGVRNYQARNNLRAMKQGDLVLYYHSGAEKAVVGVAQVVRESYPDPTIDDERWIAVDLEARAELIESVALAAIKQDAALAEMPLIRHTRLSVMPVTAPQFKRVLKLGKTRL